MTTNQIKILFAYKTQSRKTCTIQRNKLKTYNIPTTYLVNIIFLLPNFLFILLRYTTSYTP